MRKLSCLLLSLLGISTAFAALATDEVTSLPDVGPLPSKWYSGYLDVSSTKSLHYVYIESLNDTANDPVVIWLNGGPGCSSLLGLFTENGPFIFDDGETAIKPNPFPWNKRANLLYIESPAGVGFSRDNSTTKKWNDLIQSMDLFAALQVFYTNFPELVKNDLWISGESYTGVYGPYLAWQIHEWNLQAKMDPTNKTIMYSLKGFAIGNGITDWNFDAEAAQYQTLFEFNLIPKSIMDTLNQYNCKFNVAKPYNNSPECDTATNAADALTSNLNLYDLFRKVYPNNGMLKQEERILSTSVNGEEKKRVGFTLKQLAPWVSHPAADKIILGDAYTTYLRRDDVRLALHIPADIQDWEGCSNVDYPFWTEGSIWIYHILKAYPQYKLMHYSGSTDGVVATIGTRGWIDAQNWNITQEWAQWHTNDQVSGYIQVYDTFSFVTVLGVGHMAPQWKRQDMQELITKYIHGETIN